MSLADEGRQVMQQLVDERTRHVLRHPLSFAWQTWRSFRANQGLLLAGAVAYYSLLSIVPLLILFLLVFSHFIPAPDLLQTLRVYLDWLVPGQAAAIVTELAGFVQHRAVLGWVLLVTMLFFSSLAFSALENAMAVIFRHRTRERSRHALLSAILPYLCMLALGVAFGILTLLMGMAESVDARSVRLLFWHVSLQGVSSLLLYGLGLLVEVLLFTALYLVMPVGRLPWRHALLGGLSAAVLWEITRHILLWYFASLSQAGAVYGSLSTAILALLSLEIAATLLLFGAQVIAQYENPV